ncbi:hypothetical protein FOL47_000464 [Perkinsus chesapeaki]|uniref:Uncharacterized protein n=1 Tax=Perkinsus chesapeaki TaxID=330153 RepID=A0A7J6MLQ9_PERCH|nr:hypothetical protein FOL47_000464 [Perkinsus chesapeaki]
MIESRAEQPMGMPNFNTPQCRGDECVACLAGTDAQRKTREQFCRQANLNNDPPYQLPGRDPTKTYRTLSPPKIVGNDPSKWTVKDGGWRETYTSGKDGTPSKHVPDPNYRPEHDTEAPQPTQPRQPATTARPPPPAPTRQQERPRPTNVQPSQQPSPSGSSIDIAAMIRSTMGQYASRLPEAIQTFSSDNLPFVRQLGALLSIVQSHGSRNAKMEPSYLGRTATQVFGISSNSQCCEWVNKAGDHLKSMASKRESKNIDKLGDLLKQLASSFPSG